MKREYSKHIILALTAALVLNGCGSEIQTDISSVQSDEVLKNQEQEMQSLANDEFDSTIDTDNLKELTDYCLCSQEMETGGQTVNVELWLDEGVYGSEEVFVPGGGVYEENFEGQYRLLVRDEEGNILSERYIAEDLNDIGRLNFPGTFEIIVKDYNQDSCPDFTIGTYGSSAVNLYALYTIWEGGEIGLIGRDIPNCSPAEFSVAFEGSGDKTFYGSIWDNSIGEREQIVYEWDEVQKMFVEKTIE